MTIQRMLPQKQRKGTQWEQPPTKTCQCLMYNMICHAIRPMSKKHDISYDISYYAGYEISCHTSSHTYDMIYHLIYHLKSRVARAASSLLKG